MQQISRRQLAAIFPAIVGGALQTKTAQHEESFSHLQRIQHALVAGDRQSACVGVRLIDKQLENDNTAFGRRIRAHIADVWRDVGDTSFHEIEARARKAEQEWASQREYVHLSWALLSRAQLYQQHALRHSSTGFDKAIQIINGVLDLLDGRCEGKDPSAVALLRHQALRWQVRISSIYLRELDHARPFMERFRALARDIPSSSVEWQTLCEDVGYRRSWRDFCGAEKSLEEAKRLLLAQPVPHSSVAHTSILRAEIELLLAWGKKPYAAGLLEEHFMLWKRNPNIHQLNQLQSVRRACGFPPIAIRWGEIDLYQTPILGPLYQEPVLTRL